MPATEFRAPRSRWRGVALAALGLVLPFQGGCGCGCGAGLARGGSGRSAVPVCRGTAGPPSGGDGSADAGGVEGPPTERDTAAARDGPP